MIKSVTKGRPGLGIETVKDALLEPCTRSRSKLGDAFPQMFQELLQDITKNVFIVRAGGGGGFWKGPWGIQYI